MKCGERCYSGVGHTPAKIVETVVWARALATSHNLGTYTFSLLVVYVFSAHKLMSLAVTFLGAGGASRDAACFIRSRLFY